MNIVFYKTENGRCPSLNFINSLDIKMYSKVIAYLVKLKENGSNVREPFSKYLEEGIFELRIKQGSNICRVLYFFYVGDTAVITN